MRICLVCNNEIVEERFKNHFADKMTIDLFDGSTGDFSNYEAVVLIEPYFIKGQYFSIASIWHQYLFVHCPSVKLLTASFRTEWQDSNYICLLDLHDEYKLEKKVTSAKPTSEGLGEIFTKLTFEDIATKLELFFSGHNNESIIDAISKVRQVLNDVELSLYGSKSLAWEKRPFGEIWQHQIWAKRKHFQQFYSKWNYYKNYFDCLPFTSQLKAIKATSFIESLFDVFSSPKVDDEQQIANMEARYRALNPFNRIGEMAALYRKINSQYINPEVLGTILLIDDDKIFHQQVRSNFASFTVKSLYSEEETRTLSKEETFDLILLDLELELGSERYAGLDMIKGLKEKYPEVPLSIVTVHNSPEIIRHAILEEGADHFLNKGGFKAEKWATLFINFVSGKRYALGDILMFNETEQWEDSPNILVVEDEDDWYQRYEELSSEYHFVRANTIQQAKDCLKKQDFDLILLDLYLKINGEPIMVGQDLIPFVQKKFSNIPLIVISKDDSPSTRAGLQKMGIAKFLKKQSFDAERWLQIIQYAIQQKRAMSKLKSL